MRKMFNQYKKILVLAVGGGNDSVSTLLLQLQLHKKFNYSPNSIDIVAVLPDCLEYQNLDTTDHPLINRINDHSTRSVGDKVMDAFPERILSQNKNIFPCLKINEIYGISMRNGSIGIHHALYYLLKNNEYDLVLAIDVGGDFIADFDNIDVLSPMMDGYMLYALKMIQQDIKHEKWNIDIIFSVFGLGTDGESTPLMLKSALNKLTDLKEYTFDHDDIKPFIDFYRNVVEKNRYSRTTDYTLLEITGEGHTNPSIFRGRFHTKTEPNKKDTVYYGTFEHYQNESFYGRFYLFKEINHVKNRYSFECSNGIEWFLRVQKESTKINHELNGQAYFDIGSVLNHKEYKNMSLFFGTPSNKFNHEQQMAILNDISHSVLNHVYDFAMIYTSFAHLVDNNLIVQKINDDLTLISHTQTDLCEYLIRLLK